VNLLDSDTRHDTFNTLSDLMYNDKAQADLTVLQSSHPQASQHGYTHKAKLDGKYRIFLKRVAVKHKDSAPSGVTVVPDTAGKLFYVEARIVVSDRQNDA